MFFKKKMVTIKNENITLVLQGLPNDECLNLWIKNYKDWNVIISTWEDVDLSSYKIPKHWEVIKSEIPLFRYYSNVNLDYQLHTTIKGLEKVKTPYVIKARLDEYWSNLDTLESKIQKNKEKIISSSMFFRKKGFAGGKYKFHIGDKILAGTLDNMMLMFESTLHNLQIHFWDNHNPEGQLGLGYVMAKEDKVDWERIKDGLKSVDSDKPREIDLLKQLNHLLVTITNTSINISTRYLTTLVRKKDWESIHLSIKDMFGRIRRFNELIDIYHQKDSFDDSVFLKKWFLIEDINNLKPYIATRNFRDEKGRVWYRSEFNHTKEECEKDINEI